MKKVKAASSSESIKRMRPALSPEARENQLVSLAVDLAEKQLMEGTASSQVITHYLKLGSSKERLEKEKLERENELLKAKAESYQSAQRAEELFSKALKAFSSYRIPNEDEEYDEEYGEDDEYNY